MAEGQSESFRALRVENSTEDSEESESEPESPPEPEEERLAECPPLRESRLGELSGCAGGGTAEAVAGRDEAKTLTAGSSAHFPQDNRSGGLPGNSARRQEFKEQDAMSQRDILVGINGRPLEPKAGNPLVSSSSQTSLSELSPTSVAQSMSSVGNAGSTCLEVADLENSSNHQRALTLPAVKASRADGYNWRKYGQKQVKSPQGSRSYFRCTYSECSAKKIEFSDQSGHLMETIYKSQHSHDPPRKVNSLRQNRIVKTAGSVVESNTTERSTRALNGSNPSTSSRESVLDKQMVPEGRFQDSGGFNWVAVSTSKSEDASESEPKYRGKKNSLSQSSPVLKPGKKPKYVVHAAGDVGVSADGYRWRKYGQKMVKGNPHPRNYYRCTSAGCPVRKHIETAVDNADAVIITYKGQHDHDTPVPKKRHGLPSSSLVVAASPAPLSSSQGKKPDPSQTQKSPTKWSVDAEGDLTGEALELGGEKAIESARTLLSIGFEIKPC